MHFVVGLGNPGSLYEGTRHNLGFDVVDCLANDLKLHFKAGRGDYLIAEGTYRKKAFRLFKPLTYMNDCGTAVVEILERYDVPLDGLLVVCDDFHLPLGQLRVRPRGSDGGHNGLYSIIYHLQTDSFPRLRCGIASAAIPNDKSVMARFVLEPFALDERAAVKKMVHRAKDACLCVVAEGLSRTMNLFNTKPTEKNGES